MNKLIVLSAVALAGGTAAWIGGTHSPQSTLRAESDQQTTGPTRPSAMSVVRGIGYVEPVSELRRLVFKVDGVIAAVHVSTGQQVTQGQLLMALQDHNERAAVAEAQQQLALAESQHRQLLAGMHPDQIEAARRKLDVLREQLRYATKHYGRVEQLVKHKAGTAEELDEAETEVRRIGNELRQAEAELAHLERHVREEDKQVALAQVALGRARLEAAQRQLENTTLLAPCNGIVLEIFKREGEGARVVDREPVLIFADDSRLRVRAEIDERYVSRLDEGQSAEIYGRGLGEARYRGTITLVKRLMGNKTMFTHEASERKDLDVLQVFIDLPPDARPPLGLQVDVDIDVGAPARATSPSR